MKSSSEVARLVRARSPLPPDETERLIGDFFVPSRAIRFVCEAHHLDQKAVLDIGCSVGQHLIHFGPGSAGIDAVERNVEFCRALGFDVTMTNVEDGLPDLGRRFEAIYCSNLLEHLVAPHLFLLRLHALLEPNGLLFVHVPTMPPLPLVDRLLKRVIGHNGYLASEHINAFTPRTLAFTVERAGFTVDDVVFVGARGRGLLGLGEPIFRELGITAMAVARRNPTFTYPEKRVAAFEPRFAAGTMPAPESPGER
ncbi:MAG: class I SAM-dependent methyltransferase [Chloroflexi bacterium]|nr:class I SAM-dependent methyltransferase [Chloroflexota bacterium]